MSEFANDNNDAGIKKNIISSSTSENGPKTKLSLDNEYDFRGEKTKREIKNIIKNGKPKEYYPKILPQPLNFILVPNNIINPMICRKNKFDFNNVRVPNSSKIMQYKFTNRTKSNINYTKLDIKADPFFPKDIIKNNFNIVVAEAIKNHETEPLFKTDGNSSVVDDKSFAFGKLDKKLAGNQVITKLWKSFVKKNNIKVNNEDTFELSLLNKNCILSDENKNELIKLFDDAKKKVLGEQEKKLEKEIIEKKKRNDIKQKLSKQADVLINDIYKFENNYIVRGEDGERYHDKNHLSDEYINSRALRATSMLIKEKLINSFLNPEDKSVMTRGELDKIVNEVVESKKNKIEEKIASDIEKRKQILKDFNGFVSCMIDKHNDKELKYGYDYEKQKFYLPPDGFYDTIDGLETALIKIYAKRYSEHKDTEKSDNPFNPNSYNLNVDSIEVLDDITKRKLDNSISMLFKDRLDELSNIFNNSCTIDDVNKFISGLLGDFWTIEIIDDRKKDSTIKKIKKVILKNFIEQLKEPEKIKYCAIPYDCLGSISISPIYLDNIFVDVLPYRVDSSSSRYGFWYYKPNKINSNNFDAEFDELKNEYGEKNISPIAACYFLSVIKKDDLTTERLNKVWNEVNTNLWHSFSIGTDNRLMTLVNNLLDGNFPSDKYLDIFIFCLRLDIRFKWGDEPEDLYNIIYGIITNSENYRQANGDKEKETTAIKNFFYPNGFFKKFWITLGELNANIFPAYKLSYSEILTMRKMKERASNEKNEYSRKLSNLLSNHDIYISPTTEKIKDDKEKEVDQICIKVDSYKAIQTQAKKDFDKYMKKVIDDLKNDQNVKYDWAEGTLTYNEKIIYNFKNVKFYDEKGEWYDAAEETWQFCALVANSYCEDNKLPSNGFDLSLQPNDMREIQKIVGEKQQAKIKELIDGFSEFVDKKIKEYGESKEILFMDDNRLRIKVIDSSDSWSALDKSGVSDAAEACVGRCLDNYWKNKFYRSIRREEIGSDMYNNLTAKFKRLLNDKIAEYVKNNKLNYEYDEKNNCWKQITKKNKVDEKQNDKKNNDAMKIKMDEKNKQTHNFTSDKNDGKIVSSELKNKEEINRVIDSNETKETKKENEAELKKNDIIVENKANTDKNKNQNEAVEKNHKIGYGTKNDTNEKLSDEDKTVKESKGNKEINHETDKNKIEENSNNIKSQTFDSSNTNNRNQSETKNKGWIKFLTILKWIALIGCILALVMTAVSIFAEILSAATIKFVIAAVVLFFVFVMSKLLVSCLSNKKPKENENPYQKQFDTDFGKIKNQNEFNINNLVNNESNINQIGEQEKNNVSSIEDSLG